MFLKSLKIVGFKTFADETDILFDPGFTAVVGPNGSGKSNIVDAVKWVLGEKSAKGLRGEKMEDVIFHGTENRKPAGMAEVSITFDNSKKLFSLDFPTVKLSRRAYPDLTNEYLINDSRVNRKDVEKLLMDTGIGKSSYSIMEQGRVEALLNSKPEDRRAIFDEAAGISRFKVERLETMKKLEMTNQNLLRISDVMRTMEKELDLKEKQATKTKQYFDLKSELTEADKNLRYIKLKNLHNKLSDAELTLSQFKKKNDEILERLSVDAKNIETYEKKKYEIERKITEIDKKLLDFLSQKEILREKIDKNRSIMIEYDTRIDEQKASLETDTIKIETLTKEFTDFEESIWQIDKEVSITSSTIETLMNDKLSIEHAIDTELNQITERQKKIELNDSEHVSLRENLKEIIMSLINQIEDGKKQAEKSETQRDNLKVYLLDFLEKHLNSSIYEDNLSLVKIPIEELLSYKETLTEFLNIEDVFRTLFFDKDGMLAQKESIDQKVEDLLLENENFSRLIKDSFSRIEALRIELEEKKNHVTELEKKTLELQGKHNSLKESVGKNLSTQKEIQARITNANGSIAALEEKKKTYQEEVRKLEEQIEASYIEFLGMSKSLEAEKEELKVTFQALQELKSSSQKDQEDFKNLIPIISDHERRVTTSKVQLESLTEELYNDYSITWTELEETKRDQPIKQEKEETKVRKIKQDMQLLGSINPLAIDEYKNVKEIYEHHKSQKEDIETSKKDIEEVLRNIDAESEKLFYETFEVIRKNFSDTFATLFNGGKAEIILTDKEDVLNCGIEIIAEPPGKHFQNLKLLSGGEKSMTVIALLFAIYMVKPSPFCFLDEIDAALDEINKTRFCQILDKFKSQSQFIVVTHAPPTISRANTIFGVTNEEPGISKLVSLKIDEAKSFANRYKKAV